MSNDSDRDGWQGAARPIQGATCCGSTPSRHRIRRRWSLLVPVLLTACAVDASDDSAESVNTIESGNADADVSGDREGPGQSVAISLDEWNVIGPTRLDAGTVTLAVENDGTMNHQLSIVAADTYSSLPLRENGSVVIEDIDDSRVLLVTEALFAGFPAEPSTVELEAGTYVFFCALQSLSGDESHARLGQQRVVTVT